MARTTLFLLLLLAVSCQPTKPAAGTMVTPTAASERSTWNGGYPYINGYGEPTYSKPTRGTIRFQQRMSAIRRSYSR